MFLKGTRKTALLSPHLNKKYLFRIQVAYFVNPRFFKILKEKKKGSNNKKIYI